jgi:hypothetical protein
MKKFSTPPAQIKEEVTPVVQPPVIKKLSKKEKPVTMYIAPEQQDDVDELEAAFDSPPPPKEVKNTKEVKEPKTRKQQVFSVPVAIAEEKCEEKTNTQLQAEVNRALSVDSPNLGKVAKNYTFGPKAFVKYEEQTTNQLDYIKAAITIIAQKQGDCIEEQIMSEARNLGMKSVMSNKKLFSWYKHELITGQWLIQ